MSVNRELFSEPADVLLPAHLECGVVGFEVGDVPERLESGDGRVFEFRVEHVPEEDNYAHSEVRVFHNAERLGGKPPKLVRRVFRLRLREKLQRLIEPGAHEAES